MKKLLLILFVLLSQFSYSQDFENYIGFTKKNILSSIRRGGYKYSVEQKMYVQIDSVGNWKLNDHYITWMIYYSMDDSTYCRSLFTFNDKGICERYFILIPSLTYFWDYFDFFNRNYKFTGDLTWIDYNSKIKLRSLSSLQTTLYVEAYK